MYRTKVELTSLGYNFSKKTKLQPKDYKFYKFNIF